jgi:hypothetical protein
MDHDGLFMKLIVAINTGTKRDRFRDLPCNINRRMNEEIRWMTMWRERKNNCGTILTWFQIKWNCKGHGVFRDTLLFLIGLNLIRKTERYVGADSSISNRRSSLLLFSWNNQIILNHKRSSCDLSYKWPSYKYDQIGHLSYQYVRM